jgi:hypothetical protein
MIFLVTVSGGKRVLCYTGLVVFMLMLVEALLCNVPHHIEEPISVGQVTLRWSGQAHLPTIVRKC